MSKVVLKNTQTKAVVKVVSENTTDIAAADLSYTVKVESGDVGFGASGSRGSADRVQVAERLEICRVIYSQRKQGRFYKTTNRIKYSRNVAASNR